MLISLHIYISNSVISYSNCDFYFLLISETAEHHDANGRGEDEDSGGPDVQSRHPSRKRRAVPPDALLNQRPPGQTRALAFQARLRDYGGGRSSHYIYPTINTVYCVSIATTRLRRR